MEISHSGLRLILHKKPSTTSHLSKHILSVKSTHLFQLFFSSSAPPDNLVKASPLPGRGKNLNKRRDPGSKSGQKPKRKREEMLPRNPADFLLGLVADGPQPSPWCLSASSRLILSPLPRGLDSPEPLPLLFPSLFPALLHEHNHMCARSATGRGGRPPSGDKRASVGRSPAINRLLGSITVSSCDAEEAGGQREAAACSITVCRLYPLTPPPIPSTTAHFHLSLSNRALSQRHLSCWSS